MLDAEKLLPVFRQSIQDACIGKPSRESFKMADANKAFAHYRW